MLCRIALGVLALTLACSLAIAGPAARATWIVIHHARLPTVAGADTVVIAGDTIVCVGRGAELVGKMPGAWEIDAQGGVVLPGLLDPHVHLLDVGLAPKRVIQYNLLTMPLAVDAVKAYAAAHPREKWLLGGGWSYQICPAGSYPSRRELDRVVADRPVFLESYDGHATWANTKALELAGVTRATPDPAGGRIVREADGAPAGCLLEGASDLVKKVVPETPYPERLKALEEAAQYCAARGVTGLDDILGDKDEPRMLLELAAAGKLPVRVRACPPLEDDLADALKLRAALAGTPVQMGFLKGFVDGVIESRTAAMLAPYVLAPSMLAPSMQAPGVGLPTRGTPQIPPIVLVHRVLAAQRAGFQVALHAVGDAAVRESLDAYQAARSIARAGPPHRIEHCEVVDPADIPRFAKLGVVPSMQPMHAMPSGETPETDVWSENLGRARWPLAFPWRALLDAHALLAFGSDAPVVEPEPLPGIAVAMTRQDAMGRPRHGWNPNQRIAWQEAVRAYTRGAAWAMGLSGVTGELVGGMKADVVVVEPGADLTRPKTLWKARIAHVFVGGRRVAGR